MNAPSLLLRFFFLRVKHINDCDLFTYCILMAICTIMRERTKSLI